MAEQVSMLESILWDILENDYADEDTGELSLEESKKVRRLIRDYLEISDSPSSRRPNEIADFIWWNAPDGSRAAAARWLKSLSERERGELLLGDVLGLLQPGLQDAIEKLAIENEREQLSGAR